MTINDFIPLTKEPVQIIDADKDEPTCCSSGAINSIPENIRRRRITDIRLEKTENTTILTVYCKRRRVVNDYTGLENISRTGRKMAIIKSHGYDNITVQFEDGVIVEHKNVQSFKSGRIRHPDDPRQYKQQNKKEQ